jgi:hypothetical protein
MSAPKLSPEICRQAVDAVNAAGNVVQAAKNLGIPRSTLQCRIYAAELQGITRDPAKLPGVHGTSTLYDASGEVKLRWVKQTHEKGPEDWEKYVRETFADCDKIARIPQPKPPLRKDLLTVYPIGDHHVAMYAWGEEVGADYDIKISENLLRSAMAHLVAKAEPSERAVIINLGDFFHVDNIKNETSRSGHTLDVDTRYAAMIRAGLAMLRSAIECALTKHKHVTMICVIGNHDDIGSMWLAHALAQFYERNPRVEVVTRPGKFHYYRFGKVLLGTTHGDTGKPEKLQSVMAADRAEDWGATEFRYWLTGHIHTRRQLEFPGVMWETFRTLAPGDAWSHASGYRSGRDMTSITFHSEHGEIARATFNVSMLKAA